MGNKVYTEDSIQSLTPLEFTRLRPGVYAGDCTYSTQLLIEIFSNSVDEFNANHGNVINVKIDNKQIELNGDTKVNGSLTLTDADQGFVLNGGSGKTVISPQSIGSFYGFQNIANTISRLYASTSEFGSNTLTNTVIFNFTKTFSIGTVSSGKTVTLSNGVISFMKTNSSTVISPSSINVIALLPIGCCCLGKLSSLQIRR